MVGLLTDPLIYVGNPNQRFVYYFFIVKSRRIQGKRGWKGPLK